MTDKEQVTPPSSSKEWKLIEKTLLEVHAEQRRGRRWGVFFKVLTFTYLFALLAVLFQPVQQEFDLFSEAGEQHVAVINIDGPIAADQDASADHIVTSLQWAFEQVNVRGVILRINSPGGSPVQSGYIYDEIKRLKSERSDLPVYAVISDIGASGAYYIAAAADEIYADKASLVGSIGVVASGFGFVEAMERFGIERRLYTAGENKGFLDPFSPEKATEREFWQDVLAVTHQQFIDQVKQGRGDRLSDNPDLFSGFVWTGEQALELGLIDGLSSTSRVARDIIGVEAMVDYSFTLDPIEEFVRKFGVSFGQGVASLFTQQTMTLR